MVVTNSSDHLRELNDLVLDVTGVELPSSRLRFRMETGEPELRVLFADVAPRFVDRPGGYTRIVKLGPRNGDAAEMVYLELVDYVP